MAVTSVLSRHMRPDKLIAYVTNPQKTDDQVLVQGFNCKIETAAKQMQQTKERYGKTDGITMFHAIQAFKPGEVTPELAHEIGAAFVQEHFAGYEVVLATHIDRDHIHNHMAVNSVSFSTGKKYHSTKESYYVDVRGISDRLCAENGLSVIEPRSHGVSYAEYRARKNGQLTLRDMVDRDAEEVLSIALNTGEVYRLMEARGYEIEHRGKYPTFKPQGAKHGFRMKYNGTSLTEDDIGRLIENDMLSTTAILFKPREYVPIPFEKPKGFRALVAHWMYILGIIGQGKRTSIQVDPKELKRFEKLKKQEDFLQKYGIDTEEQLNERESEINARIDELTKTRIILNSKKKRQRKLYDALADIEYLSAAPEEYAAEREKLMKSQSLLEGIDTDALNREKTEVYDGLVRINKALREMRSELRIIKAVREEIPRIEERLEEAELSGQYYSEPEI